MRQFGNGAGLAPWFASPDPAPGTEEVETEEAAVEPPAGRPVAVTPLVGEGDLVPRGGAVARLRHDPGICLVAPLAGRVAKLSLLPGRRLSAIVLFREPGAGAAHHDPGLADTVPGLRDLLQASGAWPWFRRRPFGGMPGAGEVPAAIFVMAADTRPLAPDPHRALEGREDDLARGLAALARLTDGPVVLCERAGAPALGPAAQVEGLRRVTCGPRHPQGLPGMAVHRHVPAGLDAPVWDIHAEDAAAIGTLLATGDLPTTRLVHVAGPGLRTARWLRTHPGADLRQLTRRVVQSGAHLTMTGSPLDGRAAHWLGPRDRQVTVLRREDTAARPPHWLVAALTRSAALRPAIPSAALEQALGGAIPAIPFVRALGAGDDETAMKLGVLSLLEEDVALADYALGEAGVLTGQLRAMLERIETEFAP